MAIADQRVVTYWWIALRLRTRFAFGHCSTMDGAASRGDPATTSGLGYMSRWHRSTELPEAVSSTPVDAPAMSQASVVLRTFGHPSSSLGILRPGPIVIRDAHHSLWEPAR